MKSQPKKTEAGAPIGNLYTRPLARFLLTLGLLLAAFGWAYWDTLASLVRAWSNRPVYSHGFFVVPFAAWLMWRRYPSEGQIGKSQATGLIFLTGALALRWLGTHYFYNYIGAVSILPAALGMLLIAGGWAVMRWSWPAVLVLGFMLPLPFQFETALQGPLRSTGTKATVYIMQSAGLDVVAEGNVIVTEQMRMGVEDACSGLSMLLTFLFLSTAVVLVSRRSAWENGILLASAIPIALLSNVLRLTAIGVIYKFNEPELAEFVHEYAAFLMMPAALAMLWMETVVLSRLLIVELQTPIGMMWDLGGVPKAPDGSRERAAGSTTNPKARAPSSTREAQDVKKETYRWRAKTVRTPR